MSVEGSIGYAGDIPAAVAYDLLARDASAMLVDVRTQPEWNYVGAPDLSAIGKSVLFLEWQSYPGMRIAPDFTRRLGSALEGLGVGREAPLVLICRSGVRSRNAAVAMTGAGWTRCYNVADGFEGQLGPDRRRGHGGWRASGLPWAQT